MELIAKKSFKSEYTKFTKNKLYHLIYYYNEISYKDNLIEEYYYFFDDNNEKKYYTHQILTYFSTQSKNIEN
jgi:hypothetical protein